MCANKGDPVKGIVFAIPPLGDEVRHATLLASLSTYLSGRLGISVAAHRAVSYDDLAASIGSGVVQAGWLPPAVYIDVDRSVGLRAVAAAERGAGVGYYSAFFTLVGSDIGTLQDIPGHSVGWVNPNSAAGYVYPRLQLASVGIDPTTAFQEEVFFRSHAAVVRAVADRAVDIGATFVHLDPSEPHKVVRAGWCPAPPAIEPLPIRWLEPFGPLPSDVIAVRRDVPEPIAKALGAAFRMIDQSMEDIRQAVRSQFGTGRFIDVDEDSYEILRRSMDDAEGMGLDVLPSLRPSMPV